MKRAHGTRRQSLTAGVLLLLALLYGCGGGVLIISTNLGVVDGDASCPGGGGQFPLRDQQGLTLLVVLNSNTIVLASNGSPSSCRALTQGTRVSVRGTTQGSQVTAQQIRILG